MKKPKLSFWQIWNMSFGFLGIQFGFALQNGNVSRIFQTLGAEIDQIPILWIAAPVTGLIIQSILGFMVKILFDGNSVLAMLTGGISMIVAAVLMIFVKDEYKK